MVPADTHIHTHTHTHTHTQTRTHRSVLDFGFGQLSPIYAIHVFAIYVFVHFVICAIWQIIAVLSGIGQIWEGCLVGACSGMVLAVSNDNDDDRHHDDDKHCFHDKEEEPNDVVHDGLFGGCGRARRRLRGGAQ